MYLAAARDAKTRGRSGVGREGNHFHHLLRENSWEGWMGRERERESVSPSLPRLDIPPPRPPMERDGSGRLFPATVPTPLDRGPRRRKTPVRTCGQSKGVLSGKYVGR